ncbi:MAG: PDZ domain-containing protein [Lachnospiraceae bacterium]|nr:PDZ domain-containing protein [Lachnospiraceae bacterium]
MEDFEQNQDFEYIKERMKERPVNKKRLIRRMVITASMAVVFGVLACFTFLVLEPVFSNFLYPEEEPQAVEIPEDTDEMLPEDMMIVEEDSTVKPEETTNKDDEVLSDYKLLYQKIYELANKTMKSMVTVTGVSQDIDWFNNSYENKGQTSGLIVANTGREILILADEKILDKAEDLHVTFSDGTTAVASVKQTDANTEQVVIAVPVNQIGKSTLNVIDVASLGNSKSTSLLATPVIALGRPYGNTKSVAYGMITSKGTVLNLIDCNYELLTTDIYGSEEANGILLNLNGEVIGIINQKYNKDEAKNLISAVGISELKRTIERMSNGKEMAYLGINGTDVTGEANTSLGVPLGAYVTGIVMDSPAMKAGIQSGDVITKINEQEILSFSQYAAAIAECRPEETITVTLMRQGPEEYREITLSIPLEKLK